MQNGNHVVAYSCFTIVWIQGCVKSYDVFEKLDYYKFEAVEKVEQWMNLRKLDSG